MSEARSELAELDKGYEPQKVEPHWAKWWEEQGFFRSQDTSDKPPFAIVLPPPNVTGSLHLGHALTATMEDVLIRWKRMSGFNACWLPGIDHAGIATQMLVERDLQKSEKKSRHDLGREEFLKRVWAWKSQSGDRIALQHRALGASLDWDRERFTMDEQSSRAVREAFVRLYEGGLLYRAERLINWCVKDGTALSDLEVDHEEGVKSELYKFAYPLADGSTGRSPEGGSVGEIVVATTRVETMLGDTAIAVHPDDPRYQGLVGKNVRHPITGREFPIIADAELVDPKFGTGAVKVTPGHSFEDFETGKRHHLPLINILNLDGTLNANAGPFQGQDRIKVRTALKARLAELGLERGTEAHTLALGKCQRCGSVVEALLSKQWFVKTRPLADNVIAHVDEMRFVPANWRGEFLRWMTHLHDWCVSRQLWWGHQIPAWYCESGHVSVAREKPAVCDDCGTGQLSQDPDVLDTWFSSGLWPFSTLGWPEKTRALHTFYPNAVMETGFDILFFWVARMAMLGLHFLGEVPFKTVFLHAMVRDEKGEKMSKTKGNVIDPLDITAKYGADALRFTLASMAGQGRDIKLSVDRIAGYRSFANKIWNAARFVLMNADASAPPMPAAVLPARPASVYDRWILSRFQRCADETRAALDEYRLSDAASGIYRFVWNELCDWAIELSKPALYGEKTPAERAGAQAALLTALEGSLRLLHPFMPFVTEEIWQRLPNKSGPSIMVAPFPVARPELIDIAAEQEMDLVFRAIDGARSVRGEVNLPPNQRVPIVLIPRDQKIRSLLDKHAQAFQHLANAAPVELLQPKARRPRQAAVHVEPEVEVHLPLEGLIDFAAEKTRVEKEIAAADAELQKLRGRLDNKGFVERAPKEVVEKDRARSEELIGKREKLARHLARVTSVEDGMEEKNPQNPADAQAGHGTPAAGAEHGGRSPDPTGTHGGPAGAEPHHHVPPAEEKSHGAPAAPETPDAAEPKPEANHAVEAPGIAARAVAKVKSMARELIEKTSDAVAPEKEAHHDQPAKARPAAPARPKAQKARPAAKSAPATRSKAGKPGKSAKAGRAAPAKKGAKAAVVKSKKAAKKPMKAQSRKSGKGGGSKRAGGKGGAQKGARGKSGAKRPAKRKGKK